MKKLFSVMAMAMLVLSVMPAIFATDTSIGIGIEITPEEFPPLIWMCDSRVVTDDTLEGGRNTPLAGPQAPLDERANNYAFEGEQIQWNVLVMDKNKIEQIDDVVATIGDTQGEGNDIEVECKKSSETTILDSCNARILEEKLTTFNPDVMQYYTCILTVETVDSMDGEYWVTVEAIGEDGSATIDENEYWYLNPTIALSVEGDLSFEDVRPGAVAYSDTLLVGNDADDGSGVLLDMFISGTDFYDSSSSDARCPTTNRLKLGDQTFQGTNGNANSAELKNKCAINLGSTETGGDAICYYATQGAYGTQTDTRADTEGYVPIVYGDAFTSNFYNDAEIIGTPAEIVIGGIEYFAGNVLSPGSEIAITFKLGLPEPCVGNFDSGQIFFWGEAI